MWNYLSSLWNSLLNSAAGLSRTQWVMLFVAALIVGFICMRGFGSRSNY